MFPGVLDVDQGGRWRHGRVRHDHHDVGVWSKDIDESGEVAISHLHTLELGRQLAAAQLKLLDDVGDLLKAVNVVVWLALAVADYKESGTLEQEDLIGVDDVGKLLQVAFQLLDVGYECVHN